MGNEFIYGLCGGFTGFIISHPLDTIKSRVQSNTIVTIKDALKKGQLYSGIIPPLIGIMAEKSIVFGFYEKSKKKCGLNDFWSGIIGGFMSTIIVTPVDRLKINLQNQELKINNISKILSPKSLYKGLTPTIFRETPGFGIYFSTYNNLNNNYNKSNSITKNFIFGSLSGFSAWLFIYPSDLIKTKYQSTHNNYSLNQIIKEIYKTNNLKNNFIKGITNFYTGFNLALLRAMPLHGGVFVGYELSKKILS